MRDLIIVAILLCSCALCGGLSQGQPAGEFVSPQFVLDGPETSVRYTVNTDTGQLIARLMTLRLGSDSTLYVAHDLRPTHPFSIDRILTGAHSSSMVKHGSKIHILYKSGVNTTCVATYVIGSSFAEFKQTEVIAWNDRGVYRKSKRYSKYKKLFAASEAVNSF